MADAGTDRGIPMRQFPSDVAFTPVVKAVQTKKGSRKNYARMEQGNGWGTTVTPELAEYLADFEECFTRGASRQRRVRVSKECFTREGADARRTRRPCRDRRWKP